MNTKEVLVRLKISRPTLNKYIDQGLIKATKQFNGRYVFNDDEIIKLSGNLSTEDKAQSSLIKEDKIVEKQEQAAVQQLDPILVNNINKALNNCVVIFDNLERLRILTPQAIDAKNDIKELLKNIK